DVWASADEFRYVYQNVTGDATIIAHVASITNTAMWTKAGVMMRDGLTAGARNVFMLTTPNAVNRHRFQARVTANMSTTSAASGADAAAPVWVKLVRAGNTSTG